MSVAMALLSSFNVDSLSNSSTIAKLSILLSCESVFIIEQLKVVLHPSVRLITAVSDDLSQQNQEFLINGTLTKDRQLIADKFNEYFTTIGSELTKDILTVTDKPEDYLNGIYKNSMFLTPTTTDEIRIIIEKLKNCSPGWDGIKPDIIKQTKHTLA